jgi:GTP-binding protein
LVSAFVLVDIRHEPQSIDLEFMTYLGINEIPFGIIFTKADKLKPKAIERNVKAYHQELLKSWETLPPNFITSSSNKSGRDEVLQFIDQTNNEINALR